MKGKDPSSVWRDARKELPPIEKLVLLRRSKGMVCAGYLTNEGEWSFDPPFPVGGAVAGWMPMREAYRILSRAHRQ